MADLNQLKQKYQPVLDVLAKEDATIQAVDLQGERLHIKAYRRFRSQQEPCLGRDQVAIPISPTSPTRSLSPRANRPIP